VSGRSARTVNRLALPVRVVMGLCSAAPALFLAVCALASLAYAFGLFQSVTDVIDGILPFDPNDATPALAILSAIGLGALTVGLVRNKAIAWALTLITLCVSLLAQSNLFAHPVLVAAAAVAFSVLLADRRRYEVQTGVGWRRLIVWLFVVCLVALAIETLIIIIATDDWPKPLSWAGDFTWAIANAFGLSDDAGQRLLQATSRDALLGLLILLARLPVVLAAIGVLSRVAEPPPDASTRSRARAIADRYGSGALLPFQLGEDKFVFDPVNSDGLVVYGMAGRTAVVLGDLIGPGEEATQLLAEFIDRCRKLDRIPVVYQATPAGRRHLAEAGFRTFKVGEEAIVDLTTFDTAGSRRANLRHTITRCKRDGVTLRWYPDGVPFEEGDLVDDLAVIDAAWRKGAGPQMGFTISQFERSAVARLPVSVAVGSDGRAVGFTTYRRTGVDGGWVLDLMRRAPGSPPGVVEACIAEAAACFRASGATTLSLGMAPLARLDARNGPLEERLLARGGRLVQRWYDVEGLAFFKDKFDPQWVPRYGAIRHRRDLFAFVVGLLWVHLAGALRLPGRRPLRNAAAT
jgi:phosphatidylglycerol lysyltransferase